MLHHSDFLRSTEPLHSSATTLNGGNRSGFVGVAIGDIGFLVGMTVGSSRSSSSSSRSTPGIFPDNPSLNKDSSEAEEATISRVSKSTQSNFGATINLQCKKGEGLISMLLGAVSTERVTVPARMPVVILGIED